MRVRFPLVLPIKLKKIPHFEVFIESKKCGIFLFNINFCILTESKFVLNSITRGEEMQNNEQEELSIYTIDMDDTIAKPGQGVVKQVSQDGIIKKYMHYDDIVEVISNEHNLLVLQGKLQKTTNNKDNYIIENKKYEKELNKVPEDKVNYILKICNEIKYRKSKICYFEKSIKKMNSKIDEYIASKTDKELIDMEFAFMATSMDIDEEEKELASNKKISSKKYIETLINSEFAKMNLNDLRERIIEMKPELFPELTQKKFAVRALVPVYNTMEEFIDSNLGVF